MVQLYLLELLPGRATDCSRKEWDEKTVGVEEGTPKGYAYITADGH